MALLDIPNVYAKFELDKKIRIFIVYRSFRELLMIRTFHVVVFKIVGIIEIPSVGVTMGLEGEIGSK